MSFVLPDPADCALVLVDPQAGLAFRGAKVNAMSQAIGAQCAFPGRQVVSLSGDGDFAMLMGDLLTLPQPNLPVKIVIFNNGAGCFVEVEQKSTGFLPVGTDLSNPNFAAMAKAVEITGICIEDPGRRRAENRRGTGARRPSRRRRGRGSHRTADPSRDQHGDGQGFSLSKLRAVIDGREAELLDLARRVSGGEGHPTLQTRTEAFDAAGNDGVSPMRVRALCKPMPALPRQFERTGRAVVTTHTIQQSIRIN